MFVGLARSLGGTSFRWATALPQNIKLCWKNVPKTNSQADCKNMKTTVVKGFKTLPPVANVIKLFCP